ncbi:DNA polymerase ligase N-terminal domain-containing protein [Methanosalsum natronophilum]|uniref:DNA polymerase ligase N-terminal domain-containing protein n=1 Tax=Methanosalsum natronophilum TaxID=768733 RepID=UPI002168910D|nr:DNA polymerase ligase N-terminal domain-containing protein [Methanosalsum natronophilum]MCS3924290.1 DNA ligase D-like protein (predicted 3'-phosphoesterase) [Methanosalsum natronophilum]
MKEQLDEYLKKRNFKETREPQGKTEEKIESQLFVVQKHDASNLHYDFRIEVEGVLKSWAVPKGPSMNPLSKRLAIQTEDHPFEYSEFEGVIPEGQYGAGAVLVWDNGVYENINEKNGRLVSMSESIENGHIKISLKGKKLHGKFALLQTSKKKNQWLFFKMKEQGIEYNDNILNEAPQSVLSGKTIDDIANKEPKS